MDDPGLAIRRIEVVPTSGNCMFDAVEACVASSTPEQMRATAVAYLRFNAHRPVGVSEFPLLQQLPYGLEKYLRDLMTFSEPSVDMLAVLALLLDRPISLLQRKSDGNWHVYTPSIISPNHRVWIKAAPNPDHILLRYTGTHYDGLPVQGETLKAPSFNLLSIFQMVPQEIAAGVVIGKYNRTFQDEEPFTMTVIAPRLHAEANVTHQSCSILLSLMKPYRLNLL